MKLYFRQFDGLVVATMALLTTMVVATGHSPLRGGEENGQRRLPPALKVDICHIPPGNPDNFHTITISENAVDAHLAHGDSLGSCDEHCDALCDDENACTIDYDPQVGCDQGNCYPPENRPEVECDDQNECTIDSCDPLQGCLYEEVTCDDDDLCTTDSCDPAMGCMHEAVTCDDDDLCTEDSCDPASGCVFTAKTCPEGEVCDATNGQCTPIQEVVPCVAVIDEWSYSQAVVQGWWNAFRADYPKRPFCLLNPLPQGGYRHMPTNYANDDLSPDGVDRTIQATVSRDGGNAGLASDWFTLCDLGQYTSATSSIDFVGLFVDTSGSMRLSTVQASYNKFLMDLAAAGINYAEVHNGVENWVAPFMTTLVP